MELSSGMAFFFFLARLLLAGYFLYMAYESIKNWQTHVDTMKACNVPLPMIGLLVGILVQILASILLVVGQFLTVAALFLIVYLLIHNLTCNRFWKREGEIKYISRQLFITNFALMGAMLLILVII